MANGDFVLDTPVIRDRLARPSFRGLLARGRLVAAAGVAFGDAAALALSGAAALAFLPAGATQAAIPVLAFVGLCGLIANAGRGVYPGYRVHAYELLRRRATTALAVAVTSAVVLELSGAAGLALPVAAAMVCGLVLQLALAPLVRGALHAAGVWGEPAAVVAGSNAAAVLRDYFAVNWQYGVRPTTAARSGRGAAEPRPRLALVALDTMRSDELAALRLAYSDIVLLADTPQHRVAGLRPADLNGEIGVRIGRGDRPAGHSPLVRAIDLAVALPLAVLAAPIVGLAALGIWLVDPGPVFFRQEREGLDGRPLRVLKLRTMFRDAGSRLEALLAADPVAAAEWRSHFKLSNDPRVLPVVGKALRATSLDELPQLLNVIVGEMTLVGPRPFPEYHLAAMREDFRAKRQTVVPGLTGLWQISERSTADVELQQQLDEYYIDNRNVWLNLQIIQATAGVVLRRRGV